MYKSCGVKEEAEDYVQQAFVKLWENHSKVEVEAAKSWLFTTARRLFLNQIKKNQHHDKFVNSSDQPNTINNNLDFDRKDQIEKVLTKLNEKQRTIVLLRDLEGYNYNEIGEMMDLSESQVKVYLFRARKKFKEELMKLDNPNFFSPSKKISAWL